jgi:hypothetical protein
MPTIIKLLTLNIGNNVGSLLIPRRNMSAGELLLVLDIYQLNKLLVDGAEIDDGVRVAM